MRSATLAQSRHAIVKRQPEMGQKDTGSAGKAEKVLILLLEKKNLRYLFYRLKFLLFISIFFHL